ncbi:MAG: hypothetical protein SWZ49_26675, partial [Cyanobacteriota bacterium]|nr:hypothetical protein [Cyanobacteriota bacterium]
MNRDTPMKKRIMLLGASRYYIRSIIAARELGCEVIVVDRNDNADGFRFADHYEVVDISDIQACSRVAKKSWLCLSLPVLRRSPRALGWNTLAWHLAGTPGSACSTPLPSA